MKFCYIAPTSLLPAVSEIERGFIRYKRESKAHLILAHLLDPKGPDFDESYGEWYKREDGLKILDNSAFELYKQGRPMFDMNDLIDLGSYVKADYIVLSDYPNEPGQNTINAAVKLAPKVRHAGFGTFFVPQSRIGDLEDYIQTFEWAVKSPLVDYIGVSILGVPNAYGVERDNKTKTELEHKFTETRLQRYVSRYMMMRELQSRGLLALAKQNGKRIHFLGMVDGPKEVALVKQFDIDTWDSSAPVWCGANGIRFDNTPTGLRYGKFETHVDFAAKYDTLSKVGYTEMLNNIKYNMHYLNSVIQED